MHSFSKLVTSQTEGVTILAFDPPVKTMDEATLGQYTEALLKAGDADPPFVVLDLDGTEFFSSSFIEVMFRIWNRLKARAGRFAICGLHPYCQQVLEITNLHRIWPLTKTRAEAIARLKAGEHEAH
jgi:anti-anti-sigma factor